MPDLEPLDTLYDDRKGSAIPLPMNLERLYGGLNFPPAGSRPYVIGNFVSTVDGVVTLGIPGRSGGNAISGKNRHDAAVMGILRAVSDAIIVGSKNVTASPRHVWTAERVFPELAEDYGELRRRMGKDATPLNVIVSASGRIDATLPIFRSGTVNVLIVSTTEGTKLLRREKFPDWVSVDEAGTGPKLGSDDILNAVLRARPGTKLILLEGGPHLMGTFFAEKSLHELFLLQILFVIQPLQIVAGLVAFALLLATGMQWFVERFAANMIALMGA